MNSFSIKKILISLVLLSNLVACQSTKAGNRSDFLWEVVSQQCVPNQKINNLAAPCSELIFEKGSDQGHAIFKDRNGPLQYLLIPTTKITGIESPEILKSDAPNYFYEAWLARSFMLKKFNAPISDEEISLAINSPFGRSQNQLHIHISCVRPDVKALIKQNLEAIDYNWSLFPGGILGHHYFARRISIEQLKTTNPFLLLANNLPEAKNKMNEFGIALLAVKEKSGFMDFVLLADRINSFEMDRANVEEIQDHKCPQLY